MQPAAWNDEAAAILAPALGEAAAEIAAEVQAGTCELWQYPPATWLVTRLEGSGGRPVELVLVALAGKGGHAIGRQWIDIARRIGCQSVRCHSRRPGMARYIAPLGFRVAERRPDETVYRVSLEHGRQ